MSSDPSIFDPYHKWLGIAPKDQPPHHYRLLGIEAFESDSEVISSAANQRMVFLAGHAQGPYAARAAELVSKVAEARACLLDPQSRAAYDAQMRQRQPKAKTQPIARAQAARAPSAAWRDSPPARPLPKAVATDAPTTSEDVVPAFEPTAATTVSATSRKAQAKRKAAQRQFRFGMVGQIVASIVGLGIGYWLITSYGLLGGGGGEVADRAHAPVQVENNSPSKESTKPRPAKPPTKAVESQPKSDTVPAKTNPDGEPTKTAANSTDKPKEAPPAPRVNPFVQAPAELDLPPLTDGTPAAATTLCKIALPAGAEFSLALKTYITGAKASKVFRFERVDDSSHPSGVPPRWHVLAHGESKADAVKTDAAKTDGAKADGAKAEAASTDALGSEAAKIPVAAFALVGDSLSFAWLPEARSTYADALRNCVLVLRCGTSEKALPLHRCERVEAIHVGMDKNYVLTPLPANELGPPPESLRLQLLQAEQLPPGATIVPDSKQVSGADEIRFVLRSEVPAVELRARLFTSGKNTSIRIAPVMADAAGKPTPFTLERLNSLKQAATKEIADAEKLSATYSQRIKLIEAEIPRLRNTVVATFTQQNKVKAKIGELESESVQKKAEIDRLSKLIPEMKAKLPLFDPLFNAANQVRNSTKLHFRVFYVCEEKEVDVLRAG